MIRSSDMWGQRFQTEETATARTRGLGPVSGIAQRPMWLTWCELRVVVVVVESDIEGVVGSMQYWDHKDLYSK